VTPSHPELQNLERLGDFEKWLTQKNQRFSKSPILNINWNYIN
jgi:hypothetical protein